jgi:hypothetical protein
MYLVLRECEEMLQLLVEDREKDTLIGGNQIVVTALPAGSAVPRGQNTSRNATECWPPMFLLACYQWQKSCSSYMYIYRILLHTEHARKAVLSVSHSVCARVSYTLCTCRKRILSIGRATVHRRPAVRLQHRFHSRTNSASLGPVHQNSPRTCMIRLKASFDLISPSVTTAFHKWVGWNFRWQLIGPRFLLVSVSGCDCLKIFLTHLSGLLTDTSFNTRLDMRFRNDRTPPHCSRETHQAPCEN